MKPFKSMLEVTEDLKTGHFVKAQEILGIRVLSEAEGIALVERMKKIPNTSATHGTSVSDFFIVYLRSRAFQNWDYMLLTHEQIKFLREELPRLKLDFVMRYEK